MVNQRGRLLYFPLVTDKQQGKITGVHMETRGYGREEHLRPSPS